MDKSAHQMRCEYWTKIINEWAASGMKKTAWCKENNISHKAFFYWQRILRNEAYIETSLATKADTAQSQLPVAFVELKPTTFEKTSDSVFKPDVLLRTNEFVLEISNSASPELLCHLGGLFNAK